MGRPGPQIVESYTNPKWRTIDVVEPNATYMVCRDGKPIALRWHDDLRQVTGYKYRRTTFPTAGYAKALADRLNTMFKTDRYKVHVMMVGPLA